MAQEEKQQNEFKWETMGGVDRTQKQLAPTTAPGKTLGAKPLGSDGPMKFAGKPSFKKSEHVGNKSEFPELGDTAPKTK